MTANRTWLAIGFALLVAQTGPTLAAPDPAFGPAGFGGSFYTLESDHDATLAARAVRRDASKRIWVLQDWRSSAASPRDCSVQRYLQDGLLPDMDFGGAMEATQRIGFNLGGSDDDACVDLELAPLGRSLIFGTAATSAEPSGVVARLDAGGSLDPAFHDDGRTNLRALGVLTPQQATYLNDGIALPSGGALACGYALTNGNRDMLVVKLAPDGELDPTFSTVGFRLISFNVAGDEADVCETIELLPDGDILLGGYVTSGSLTSRNLTVVRLDGNGALDTAFGDEGRVTLGLVDGGTVFDDIAYDIAVVPNPNRIYVVGEAIPTVGNDASRGVIAALEDDGDPLPFFGDAGQRLFRFADPLVVPLRGIGDTRARRIAIDEGVLYVGGTHRNTANTTQFGDYDVALMAFSSASGAVQESFGVDGVSFQSFQMVQYANVEAAGAALATNFRQRIDEHFADFDLSDGRLSVAFSADRHPAVPSYDGIPALPKGALAPALSQFVVGMFADGFEGTTSFPGVAAPSLALAPPIPVPSGYARYCSVREPGTGNAGLATTGADPCQPFIDANPSVQIERAGLYSVLGQNQALRTCGLGASQIALARGFGDDPLQALFGSSAGLGFCVFTAAPQFLPIFERPYNSLHPAANAHAFFNHTHFLFDPQNAGAAGVDVDDFGQPHPDADHLQAHTLDYRGRQQCRTAAGGTPHDFSLSPDATAVTDINELAIDATLPGGTQVLAMADGVVLQAVPRYVINSSNTTAPAGSTPTSPWQREVFVGHRVGDGRYEEQFASYYAHMLDTPVRVGEVVRTGSVLGRIGNTGASGGDHIHYAVLRYNNLSFRRSFRFRFDRRNFGDYNAFAAAIDPFGWKAPDLDGHDPQATMFRHSQEGEIGAFSIDLWLNAGERPPTN
jgi:uncharacterized delta-60 repeat protein